MTTRHQILRTALLGATALLSTIGVAHAQTTVSLTAARQSALMPDGITVPMWGLTCNANTTFASAAATATVASGAVTAISISSGGAGYSTPPVVTITGGGGSGATAVANLPPAPVASITVTAGGSGYTTAPTVTLTGGGVALATATAAVTGGAVSATLTSGGSGYTSAPTVTFTGGGGSGATATATVTGGAVTAITITAGGTGYTTAPTITFTGGGIAVATATATVSAAGAVTGVAVTSTGAGYSSAPTVTFTGAGAGATAAANLPTRGVTSITVTAGGTGYTSAPTVSLGASPATAATATATAALTGTSVSGITVTNGGSGYTTTPGVTISGGGGSGATATATLTNGSVSAITVTNGGTGYTSAPTVALTGSPSGFAVGGTCTAANGLVQRGGAAWQPPLIVAPYVATGTSLTITLTNSLPIRTSLWIVGQLPNAADAYGLGHPTREGDTGTGTTARPQHPTQTATTWTQVLTNQVPFTPPTQGARARAFVQEAAAAATSGTTVTPGSVTYSWSALAPGTYLIESASYPSIQGPMGLYGVLVVTTAPSAAAVGTAYPSPTGALTATGVQYDADAVALLSEVDPQQNDAADAAVTQLPLANGAAFSELTKWTPGCGAGANVLASDIHNTCYPPAVDFTPMYYLVNGVAFDPANPSASQINIASTAAASKGVLLRLVNAGLKLHMPSVVGLQLTQVAEDGHVQPDVNVALMHGNFTQAATGATFTQTVATTTVPTPKIVSDAFMPAGKVIDALVFPASSGAYTAGSYALFDRELSLSASAFKRDSGMEAFLVVNGGAAGTGAGQTTGGLLNSFTPAAAVADSYIVPHNATTFAGNVLANDVGIHNASSPCVATTGSTAAQTVPAGAAGTVTLNPDGSFTLAVAAGFTNGLTGTFTYCGNGNSALSATVTFYAARVGGAPTANADTYTSDVATLLQVGAPGVLINDTDPDGFPLTAAPSVAGQTTGTPFASSSGGCTITLESNGAFVAQAPAPSTPTAQICTFTYSAVNSQGTASGAATVTINFLAGSGLQVKVIDPLTSAAISDYKWIIEQDLTYYVDPNCQQYGPGGTKPATCPAGFPPTLGTQFHASYMPVIASGCTGPQSCGRGQSIYDNRPACTAPGVPVGCSATAGQHVPAICDTTGICSPAAAGVTSRPISRPDQVSLTATNPDGTPARYYISILPGDAANAFNTGYALAPTTNCFRTTGTTPTGQSVPLCGHSMSGAAIPPPTCATAGTTTTCTFPAGVAGGAATGGVNAPVVIKPPQEPLQTATVTVFVFEDDWPLNGEHDGNGQIEPGLGGFQVLVWDDAGSTGDATGQNTYDMFNMPLGNSLNGTIDPLTGLDACPLSKTGGVAVGMIIVCPQYEADGLTPSPLVGQAVVKNLMPGRYGIIVHPSAAREAAGEVWLQTNTLDGTHFLDSFLRSGEPAYFQEFGPGAWHVFMGMANPQLINNRKPGLCAGLGAGHCSNTVNVNVSNLHMSRPPNEALYDSSVFPVGATGDARNYQQFAHTTCWGSLGDPDGGTFMLQQCDNTGHITFSGVPDGNWAIVVFDQWLDIIVDGSSKPINVTGGVTANYDIPAFTWQQHIWTNTYMDLNGNGIQDPGEPGLLQVPSRVRFRNGKFSNTLFSDIGGLAHFNETFPLFNWYVVESDTTRFRGTGVHVVNDVGGQIDGPGPMGNGDTASAYQALVNTHEVCPLPANLRYPGSVYCAVGDPQCARTNLLTNPTGGGAAPTVCTVGQASKPAPSTSTGRIDPGTVETEGLQGFVSQTQILDWGKMPYVVGENGGIRGHVVYASTRPFDDPQLLFQNLWEPMVPNVTINLYQESLAPDGTVALKLVDTTTSASWDAYAQGFRSAGVPNMNCPGQDPNDPFFGYTLAGTLNYLNPANTLPDSSLYKCYDGMHAFNQIQPAPYDGLWEFPSPTCKATPGATYTVASGPMAGKAIACATVHNPAYGTSGPASVNGVVQTGAVPAVLPSGKYVVEIVVPRGYELEKEEDKNLLIGDNYIAPTNPQFAGLSDIFIVPDQATVNTTLGNPWYGSNYANPSYTGPFTGSGPYNTNGTPNQNNHDPNTNRGRSSFGDFGPGGLLVMSAPCVGALRIVPDYLQISPESGEVAPFAGALRHLCDRREVTLEDQSQGQTDFFIWTQTPAATHYTGFILDDFSSEFDPASPTFGEKFAVPNLPVSIKDFNGVELSRTMSDQWGIYNGLVFSTWQVNPPNITGYSPGMEIACMNDPGPIPQPVCTTPPTATTAGFPPGCTTTPTTPPTLITDPWFNPAYSTFCYENPFMPEDTTYLDTPVVPVSAFAEGYNPPDCAYPDGTPAIKSVTGDAIAGATGRGPWVSAANHTITITSLGDQIVPNHAYSGPAANTAPYNQKFVTRHYGFGTARGSVTIGGRNAQVGTWNDTTITATVPGGLPPCAVSYPSTLSAGQAATAFGACGQLVITKRATAGNALTRNSIDAVTITVGGKAPKYVTPSSPSSTTFGQTSPNPLQTAIDTASPGDLIIVGPGTYSEMLVMWKPVRLQGVGAASVKIDANAQPSGNTKIDAWRRRIDCLFGLSLSGAPIYGDPNHVDANGNPQPIPPTPYDPTGTYQCEGTAFGPTRVNGVWQSQVDTIPLEPMVGWDSNLNGNIAELLQEPTLMGAYEGAGITVLAKGLENNNSANCTAESNAGCIMLNKTTDCVFGGNFLCAPGKIDGIGLTNSSQGGGGIVLHGWNHFMEVANNRVYNNAGTLSGGITVGQAETPDPNTVTTGTGTAAVTVQQALALNVYVDVHNNAVTFNAAYGDELNSNTPAAAGGVTICTGADNYTFDYNWVCGNMSTGDGGGMAHYGFSFNGSISHNAFMFNQSNNPTLTTWGGGVLVYGHQTDATVCETSLIDIDCPASLSMGTGPGLVIDHNLIQGNTAESGSGGGLRIQMVNGVDVQNNPSHPETWYDVRVTNNIIVNNVAGWAGGGVSLQDAVRVRFNSNTVASNDSTATAGVLFDTLGAPNSNVPPAGCTPATPSSTCPPVTNSNFQPAGFVTQAHTGQFAAVFTNPNVGCGAFDTVPATHACTHFSVPAMDGNVFWFNRAFHITVGGGALPTIQLTPSMSQTTTGSCPSGASYWDIGVIGDTSPTPNSGSGLTLHPTGSQIGTGGYHGNGNSAANPNFTHMYCNGSRVPPEIAPLLCTSNANAPGCIQPGTTGVSMTVPAGAPDNNPPYVAFTLNPAATVDEGNNWINMFYGPLTTTNPVTARGATGYNALLGDYSVNAGPAGAEGAIPW
jgi:hypothetical protein